MKKIKLFIALITALTIFVCGCSQEKPVAVQHENENTSETITTQEQETTATETHTTPVTAETETEPADECHCEYDWQHAYAEYIDDLDYFAGLYIEDINGDDIPEAVIKRYNTYKETDSTTTIILYYTEDGLAELVLEPVSVWGRIYYIADTKQILFCRFYGHTQGTYGNEEYYLYDWTGTEYEVSSSIFRESGYYWYDDEGEFNEVLGQAYIDGEEVDNDAFEVRYDEFRELETANDYFHFVAITDENFESYAKEKLPDFKMPEFDYFM